MASRLVFERCDDSFCASVYYVAGRRISVSPVDVEGHPAGLVSQLDAHHLLWRHLGGVENMDAAVKRVGEPYLLLIGRQRDAVTWAAVAFGRPFLKSCNLD